MTGGVKVTADYLRHFFAACRVVRAQFVVAVFAFIALSLPPQTREVYRVLADDFPNQKWQIVLGFLSLLVASSFIWQCGRQATLIAHSGQLQEGSMEGQMLRWVPRILAALVPLGAALGLHTTIREAETTSLLVRSVAEKQDWPELAGVYGLIDASPARLWVGAGIALGLALLVLVVTTLRTSGSRRGSYAGRNRWLVGTETTICSGTIALTCVAMFSLAPPWLAQTIGVMAIFGLFLTVLVVVLSTLLLWGDALGVPIIWLLVGATLLLTALDWNDNHQVEIVAHQADGTAQSDLAGSFGRWLHARADRDYYDKAGEPYPVFVVAAAGGGAYSAYYTATLLARMQDSCPNFAQHVFAISGVSGGSIGASLFAGLSKLKARNEPYAGCNLDPSDRFFEKRTQKFFEQDFLSPVIAGALFPDLVQRFLPVPIGPFDRSRALDASLEAAWDSMIRAAAKEDPSVEYAVNPFASPFLDLWVSEREDEAVPSLILNTTEVANGYRIVISPIETGALASIHWSKLARLHPLLPPQDDPGTQSDVKLSTAAGISARFPWVLPPATVATNGEMKRMRLVDGGYIEGSGLDVAGQLVKTLKTLVRRSRKSADPIRAKFYLIALMGYEGTRAEDPSLGEAPLPLRALISTWQTRSEIAFLDAFVDACPELATCLNRAAEETSYRRALVELPVVPIFLNLRDFHIPLTWQLTQASREIISLHTGAASRCKRDDTLMMTWPGAAGPVERIVKALGENSCSLCTMQYRLAHRTESPEWTQEYICVRPPASPAPSTTSALPD